MFNVPKGCKSVAHDAPSITLELLAKCSVHFPIVVKNERIGGHISSIRIFVQVGQTNATEERVVICVRFLPTPTQGVDVILAAASHYSVASLHLCVRHTRLCTFRTVFKNVGTVAVSCKCPFTCCVTLNSTIHGTAVTSYYFGHDGQIGVSTLHQASFTPLLRSVGPFGVGGQYVFHLVLTLLGASREPVLLNVLSIIKHCAILF